MIVVAVSLLLMYRHNIPICNLAGKQIKMKSIKLKYYLYNLADMKIEIKF